MEHDGLGALGSRVSEAAEATQRRIAEFREQGFDKVAEDVLTYLRAQPINALLIGAGLGMIIGVLSGLRRR